MNTTAELFSEIKSKLAAGVPGFYVQTAEENRADELLQNVCRELALRITEWNHAYGWVSFDHKIPLVQSPSAKAPDFSEALAELLDASLEGLVIVVKNAGLVFENNGLGVARLQHLLNRISRSHSGRAAVVLVSEHMEMPPEIETKLAIFSLALPQREEIQTLLTESYKLSLERAARLAIDCGGLSLIEIKQALTMAADLEGGLEGDVARSKVLAQKTQVIAKGGVLEMIDAQVHVSEVGGLENLKSWLARRAKVINNQARADAFGVSRPKGVLIAGMPGCGKSLIAKMTATQFGLPLLRLDIGSLLGKYVGESEHNMRRALHTAEAISPCVLWIDELEKAFVGMGGNNASEVTSRLLGFFLTWMQEKSGSVFTIATANDITALPPELLRKGRFDEVFYVGFPNEAERQKILKIHVEKRRKGVPTLNWKELASHCKGYSGADIENAVNEAVEQAFLEDRDLSQQLLLEAIKNNVSLRETMREKVAEYEDKFEKLKLKPASLSDGMDIAKMISASEDANYLLRLEVASHEDAPHDLLERLSGDVDVVVRKAVLSNHRCPASLLSKRLSIAKGDKEFDWELFHLACVHPNAPLDLILDLIRKDRIGTDHIKRILLQTDKPDDVLRAVEKMGTATLLDQVGEFLSSSLTSVTRYAASEKELSAALQHCLASLEKDNTVRRLLAANDSIECATMQILAKDPYDGVREELANNPSLLPAIQRILSKDQCVDVRVALAANEALDVENARAIAGDENEKVRMALAKNAAVRTRMNEKRATDDQPGKQAGSGYSYA
ncbi:AAA family ATPase [Achromobacter marplatensis]|uniref:Uncharacterized AAA domain-containing protein ycf46 n=1 Tax=Achromobacter marplatensis TaxID=470868 RepID=A0AA43B0C8_9BURK|nr:AAA family ATPase [Achromobacter marplatensis]MDH2050808.1 AAA family ATPase [Achromobacter marplatensis]